MSKDRLGFQPSKRHIFVEDADGNILFCKTCRDEERKRLRERRKEG